jgi:HAD superfamily hydrolase (TIGR01509 family)
MGRDKPVIQALIFDMDGLLIDSEGLAASAMDAFLAGYGLMRRQDVHAQLLGRRLPEAIAIVRESYGLEIPLDVLVAEYGELRLAALRGAVRLMPGALEVIEFGRMAGLKIGLATSGMRAHAAVSLSETGLRGMFDVEVTGDEVEYGKPKPDLFLLAAKRLGVEPAACVVFEDAPNGVAAAQEAGMRVAAVPAPGHDVTFETAPDVVLASLAEASGWLASLGVVAPAAAPS